MVLGLYTGGGIGRCVRGHRVHTNVWFVPTYIHTYIDAARAVLYWEYSTLSVRMISLFYSHTYIVIHTYIQTELWSAPPSLSQVPLPIRHKCPSPSVTSAPPHPSQVSLPLRHKCPSLVCPSLQAEHCLPAAPH